MIGGTRGNSDGSKVLEPVVHALIEPNFLPSISWTGRGRGKEVKIALSKYTRITNVITDVMNRADRKFDQTTTIKNLKYKIIKHAPTRYASNEKNDTEKVKNSKLAVNETVAKYVLWLDNFIQ